MKIKLNMTIDPSIRAIAESLAATRRRSLSQLFEDLTMEEWDKNHAARAAAKRKPIKIKKRRPGRTP